MDSVVVVESGWRRAGLCVANPVAQCDVSEEPVGCAGRIDSHAKRVEVAEAAIA